MSDFTKAKRIAEEVLAENYITKPPVPVTELAKNYGYEVVNAVLPPNIAGLVDISKHIIYTNSRDSDTRKAFTVAHELGHIKLHADQLQSNPDLGILYRIPLGKKNGDEKEQEANYFAASLLVPRDMYDQILKQYKDVLPDSTEGRITLLSTLFGVSQEVMGYRLTDFHKNGD